MLKNIFQGVRGLVKDVKNENLSVKEKETSGMKEENGSSNSNNGIVKFVPGNIFQEVAISIRESHKEEEGLQAKPEAKYSSLVVWNEIFGNEELFQTDYDALQTISFCLYLCIFNFLIKNNYSATALEAKMQYDVIFDEIKDMGYEFIDALLPGFKEAKFIEVKKPEKPEKNGKKI